MSATRKLLEESATLQYVLDGFRGLKTCRSADWPI
jgi:hypothetical protein